jgi:hypothetical protein
MESNREGLRMRRISTLSDAPFQGAVQPASMRGLMLSLSALTNNPDSMESGT